MLDVFLKIPKKTSKKYKKSHAKNSEIFVKITPN